MEKHNILIEGDRIYLRELTEEDASEEYCNWINDPVVNRFLETKSVTIEGLKLYIEGKRESSSCLFLGIFTNNTMEHIGNIKLEPIDWASKKASIGILIGDKNYWGRGICTEVVKLVTEHAFENLCLEKVDLGVMSENKAAIKCYLKAGFEIEQTKERAIKHGSKFYDKVIMSIRKLDFVKT